MPDSDYLVLTELLRAVGGVWGIYMRETDAFSFPNMGFRAVYAANQRRKGVTQATL